MDQFAPIVLFVYNRPWHTQQTIKALQKNDFADKSNLIIFSDAPKSEEFALNVQEVRSYLKTITGFESVRIIERDNNYGLARSIIEGVSEMINQYGKVIVLEDDIVTSPKFLQFMNKALHFYQNEKMVWHISGWNYPIDSKELGDAFLWKTMNCWGWATWADRWKHFEKKPQILVKQWKTKQKRQFDLDGSGIFWNQIESNLRGTINTWAIFWYATIFQNNGLCLNPSVSYVENIGHDVSGVHCGIDNSFSVAQLNTQEMTTFPTNLVESTKAVKLIKKFYKNKKKSLITKLANLARRKLLGSSHKT
ncbi:MAG: glycosyltransferase [Bacteriovoracaceae bacterium]|nr:glycosyltransferase [Bacteriovoracaceae bacterium]